MKRYYILSVLIAAVSFAHAQSVPLYVGISGHAALPKSSFEKNAYEKGGGVQLLLLSGAINKDGSTNPWNQGFKLQIGFGLEFNKFGAKSFDIDLANPPGARGKQEITNNSAAWYGIARGSFTNNRFIIPFAEVLLGARSFTSREVLSVLPPGPAVEPITTDTFKASVGTLGLGIGIALKITDHFFIEAKTTYFIGGSGTYLPISKAQQPSNQVFYYPQTSNTNVLLTQVGITWRLGPMFKSCGSIMGVCGSMNNSGNYTPTSNTRTTSKPTPQKTDPMQRGTSKTTTPQIPGGSATTPSNPTAPKKRIEVKPDTTKPVPR